MNLDSREFKWPAFFGALTHTLLRSTLSDVEAKSDEYAQILLAFSSHCKTHSHSNPQKVVNTVLACAKIEYNLDQISSLNSEIERIKLITSLCGIQAEPSLCPGTDAIAIKATLNHHLKTLQFAFRSSEAKGHLPHFFDEGFSGDSCINGRFTRIARFATRKEWGEEFQQQCDHFSYDDISFKLTEQMYNLGRETPPEKEKLTEYLKSNENFEEIYTMWMNSQQCDAIFRRAVELFV